MLSKGNLICVLINVSYEKNTILLIIYSESRMCLKEVNIKIQTATTDNVLTKNKCR